MVVGVLLSEFFDLIEGSLSCTESVAISVLSGLTRCWVVFWPPADQEQVADWQKNIRDNVQRKKKPPDCVHLWLWTHDECSNAHEKWDAFEPIFLNLTSKKWEQIKTCLSQIIILFWKVKHNNRIWRRRGSVTPLGGPIVERPLISSLSCLWTLHWWKVCKSDISRRLLRGSHKRWELNLAQAMQKS